MFIYISISTIQKTRYTNYSVTQIHSKCILHKIFKYKQCTDITHHLDEEIKLLENNNAATKRISIIEHMQSQF